MTILHGYKAMLNSNVETKISASLGDRLPHFQKQKEGNDALLARETFMPIFVWDKGTYVPFGLNLKN